jgi:cell division protein FtsB
LRRWFARRWHLVGALLVCAYFVYHGIHGDRGLLAWTDKARELADTKARLASLEDETRGYTAKIDALQPDRSDPDLLEEHLRQLGYISKGEVILLPKPTLTPPR